MMKRFRKSFRDEKGFTLVELLVVIAVLGILAAVAVPRLTGVKDRAYEAEAQHALDAFKTGVGMYHAEKGVYPDSESTFYSDVADVYVDQFAGSLYEGWDVNYTGQDGTGNPSGTNSQGVTDYSNFAIVLSKTINGNSVSVRLPHDSSSGYLAVVTSG